MTVNHHTVSKTNFLWLWTQTSLLWVLLFFNFLNYGQYMQD